LKIVRSLKYHIRKYDLPAKKIIKILKMAKLLNFINKVMDLISF